MTADPSIAVAASRGGHIGILNWELPPPRSELSPALEHLLQHGRGEIGIALRRPDATHWSLVTDAGSRGLGWLILDSDTAVAEAENPALQAIKLLVEITDWDERLCDVAGLSGIVVKGNEAGGRVGEQTSFILLQRALSSTDLPVWVRGGMGLHSVAAARAAGAAGVVLDDQLLLARESCVRETVAKPLSRFNGSETAVLEIDEDRRWRVFERPALQSGRRLAAETRSADDPDETVARRVGWDLAGGELAPLGQAASFAPELARRFTTVGRIASAYAESGALQIALAAKLGVLGEGSGVAQTHGTRYPIVQGPMTRVSDTPGFAGAVADAGGLPMVALALMRPDKADALLAETQETLKGQPWGVGLLGFAPAPLLKAQVEVARRYKPRFALIAGGRPDQAKALEADGIDSYLHVPSPGLLAMFLDQGARRFVFEGRECGGHVGPLSSFVLWDHMIDALSRAVQPGDERASEIHVLFAGGIHDAVSAAMVAAISAPLAERGIRVGILVGTAYLFTKEAVACGSIVQTFQKVALACRKTVTLETGPGHASRAALSAFADEFLSERRRLEAEGTDTSEIRDALEDLTLGRLRIATKAIERRGEDLKMIAVAAQKKTGMYMIGQAATLRDRVTTVAKLHSALSDGVAERLFRHAAPPKPAPATAAGPADVAIVGIGAYLPGAVNASEYWENILDRRSAIREIPRERWDVRLYFDEDRHAKDKIYSRFGGFLEDMPFDPMHFGIPPKAVAAVDPLQLMALEVARRTLEDAGYPNGPADRSRASVILGASGGAGDIGAQYAVRSELTRVTGEISEEAERFLPAWTEDSFAGILLNVAAGRTANRLDFGGVNYTVDSACASSLTAIYHAVLELETGRSDFVIAGGVDTVQGPFGYLCFSKTQALSPRGRCGAFEADADGIVISEGIAMVALKRLADAEADGDRIYAVIKGVGGSSDGRARSMTAPHPGGQIRALTRAYEIAGYSPATVGLFEAHGTGTVAGDTAELETVSRLLDGAGGHPRQSAIGSVKTLIGHTKASAGIAGVIKAAFSCYHGVLPPHGRKSEPNARLADDQSRLFLVDEATPWLAPRGAPRRAGVSAFGFGGTNFHLTMEEHDGAKALPGLTEAPRRRWSHELLIFAADDRTLLAKDVRAWADRLQKGSTPDLADLAFTLARRPLGQTLATLVVGRDEDLVASLRGLADHLAKPDMPVPRGASVSDDERSGPAGKLAWVFPGQGTQYPSMFRELALLFPEFARVLETADDALAERMAEKGVPGGRLSRAVFPVAQYSDAQRADAQTRLTRTDIAQPALGAVEAGLVSLLRALCIVPDMTVGHSYGEFVALYAAGVIDLAALLDISEARGRFMVEAADGGDLGTMAAVHAERTRVAEVVARLDGVTVANHNAPEQTIISGAVAAVDAAIAQLGAAGMTAQRIPVGAAFHSPIVAPATEKLAMHLAAFDFSAPQVSVFSNLTGAAYPEDPAEARNTIAGQLANPVEFVSEVEAMYEAGARVFLNVGPKRAHARMVSQILGERPHRALAIDDDAGGLQGLLAALGALVADGFAVTLDRLWQGRGCRLVDLAASKAEGLAPHVWLLNGSGARKATDPPLPVLTLEEVEERKRRSADAGSRAARPVSGPPPSVGAQKSMNGGLQEMDQSQKFAPLGRDEGAGSARVYASANEDLMIEFQATMARFLETQERVMLAHLDGGPSQSGELPRRRAQIAKRTQPVAISLQPARGNGASNAGAASVTLDPVHTRRTEAPPPPAASAAPAPAPAAPPAVEPPRHETAPAAAIRNAATEAFGEAQIRSLLLGLVEDRTGYPQDMLPLDQNIEADLGIDSIKRVEIVGALLEALPEGAKHASAEMGETLNACKTLGAMIATLDGHVQSKAPEVAATSPFELGGAQEDLDRSMLPRHVLRPEAENIPDHARGSLRPGTYLITRDRVGIADALAGAISAAGAAARIVEPGTLDPDADLAAQLGGTSDVVGLIHLAACGAEPLLETSTREAWRTQIATHEKLAHVLTRCLAPRLQGGGLLFASAFGGLFCRDSGAHRRAVAGGGPGLAKTLREEWGDTAAKAVDLDPAQSPRQNAAHLLSELSARGGRVEVGYPAGQRTIFRTVPSPTPPGTVLSPASDWVIVATGGSRGITAECLRPLAARGVTLVVLGRSELPAAEPEELAGRRDEAALRAHFLADARDRGETVTPAQIARKIARVRADREMRANIADFEAAGAAVDYRSVDVADPEAVQAEIAAIYDAHGRIDGVVHGAGVIEDKLIVDKTSESWDRVAYPKLFGALALAEAVRVTSLKFFALFTSVAGRYGNSGQGDYAAANEVMNRLACQLAARWPDVRVLALNWGPWAGTRHGPGMVSDAARAKFAAMGVELVDPADGAGAFWRELTASDGRCVEVILGDGPWEALEAEVGAFRPETRQGYSLLNGAEPELNARGGASLRRPVSLATDPCLEHHKIDGTPVLPLAFALEILSQAAASVWPDRVVTEVAGHRLLNGVKLDQGAVELEINVVAGEHGQADCFRARVDLRSVETGRIHYRAETLLGACLPQAAPAAAWNGPATSPITAAAAYRKVLSHGPSFQLIRRITGLDPSGAVADVVPREQSRFAHGDWVFDAGLIDAAAQLAWVWSSTITGRTALPNAVARARRFDTGGVPPSTMELRVREGADGSRLVADVYILTPDRRTHTILEGLEATADKRMNRINSWSGEVLV